MNMKSYNKYFLVVVLVFVFSACKEEFLDFVPEDQATVDSWYRNAKEIRQATGSLYGTVQWNIQDEFAWLVGDLMPGDMYHNWDQEGQYFYMSFNENNQYLNQGWQGFYNVISIANLIIDDMPSRAAASGVSQSDINRGLGEARFMRGWAYFMLTEYWGEAPIIEKPAEKVIKGQLQLPKNTTANLYEFARRDLAFAAENLPPTDDPGRVTSWAAKGMLAKLHVTLGQRSVGGDGIGSAEDFTIAANYAADVINNSGRTLFPNYEDLFKIPNEDNSEILFAQQCINNGWSYGSSRLARSARSTEIADKDAWGSGKGMTISFINNAKNIAEGGTDKRRRAIYMQSGDKYDYLAKKKGGYTYKLVSKDDKGAQLEGVTPTLTSLKKHVVGTNDDIGFAISNQDSPFDIYYLRLADVYLLYAEALLGSGSSLSSGPGYAAYVAVRTRAGLSAPVDGNMTYVDLFNERRMEFGLEGQSWLDVKRRYYRNHAEALAYLNGQGRTDRYYRIDSKDLLENDPNGYELVPAGTTSAKGNKNTDPAVVFTDAKMRLPIPGTQVVNNPLLAAEAVEYSFTTN